MSLVSRGLYQCAGSESVMSLCRATMRKIQGSVIAAGISLLRQRSCNERRCLSYLPRFAGLNAPLTALATASRYSTRKRPYSLFSGMMINSAINTNLITSNVVASCRPFQLQNFRFMNRNARRPKRSNHGKRPVSHARRRAKKMTLKSRLWREKIFGFW